MKKLLFTINIIFFLSWDSTSYAEIKKLKKAELLIVTGLVEGEYLLKKGAEECADGEVKVTGEEGNYNILVGPHVVVEALGLDQVSDKERDCEWTIKSQFAKAKISSEKVEKCKNLPSVKYTTELRLEKNKIKLFKKNESENKINSYACDYEILKN